MKSSYDIAILGAGASGQMLASLLADKRATVLLEGNTRPGAKIAVSGGGRCNLTNRFIDPRFYRGDAGFIDTVMKGYDRRWLLEWFARRGVEVRLEKERQYFCTRGAFAVNRALEGAYRGVELRRGWRVAEVVREAEGFLVRNTGGGLLRCRRLVVASGGLSFPKLGATGIGLQIAERFGHRVVRPAPALVGWTLQPEQAFFKSLSGVSAEVEIRVGPRRWRDRLLCTHRGLSGPAVLNASLWWERGEVSVDFLPDFVSQRLQGSRKQLTSLLPLPRRLTRALLEHLGVADLPVHRLDPKAWHALDRLRDYRFAPAGTFGYSKAEAMRGGVATDEVDPKTMESRKVPGLYFLGEVLDVTGEVGGYNFQWAFSSAARCAESLNCLRKETP